PALTPLYAAPFESAVADSDEDEGPGPFTDEPSIWEEAAVGEVLAPVPADTVGAGQPRSSIRQERRLVSLAHTGIQLCYLLPTRSQVRLEILDSTGRHVLTLREAREPAGRRDVAWLGVDQLGHPCPIG